MALVTRPDRYRQGRLTQALGQAIRELYGVVATADDWDRSRIDQHLLMNVQVLDESGRIIAQGRDATVLKRQFAERLQQRMGADLRARIERSGLAGFPADVDPTRSLLVDDGTGPVAAYPALVDAGDHVDLQLFPSAQAQAEVNRRGYARLALLGLGSTARALRKGLERERELGLHYASLGTARELQERLLCGVAWYCFFEGRPLPADVAAFEARIVAHRGELARWFDRTLAHVREILALRFELVRLLDGLTSPAFSSAVADARAHLAELVPADLLASTPSAYLAELPRYLEGLRYRLTHLQGRVQRDRDASVVVAGFAARLARLREEPACGREQAAALRFAIEELRLALFAEPLGTRMKTSPQRLDRELHLVERELGLA
jgi:ATP-dependent helicase HrpA